jgi:Fic family protein
VVERHSQTKEQNLIADPHERALAEARNALRQFDVSMLLLQQMLDAQQPNIRPSDLLTLNRFALDGIHPLAGTFRASEIEITGSGHAPPRPESVPALVEDFCEYVNRNWEKKSAIHLAAYALWRLNWIHPFADGNGRTARAISYVLLCAKLGYRLPGTTTIPEKIAADKQPYYLALEAADRAFAKRQIELSQMEELLQEALAGQLLSIHNAARDHQLGNGSPATVAVPTVSPQDSLIFREAAVTDELRTVHRHRESYLVALIERNPVLFTGVFAIGAAILTAVLTVLLT